MSHGGARNRSGPQHDPESGRSEARGIVLTALPSEGYRGEVPEFPLPRRRVQRWEQEDKHRYQVLDADETERVAEREMAVWEWAWRTPQACAWATVSESWRLYTVAMWVRTFVICEGAEATAADKGALHRFADQIGLTPAGLKENGWAIATDELAAKAKGEPRKSARDRMKVVNSGDGE